VGDEHLRYEIREFGVSGVLDQAIALVRDHFWLLTGIMLFIYIPTCLVVETLRASADLHAAQSTPRTNWLMIASFFGLLVAMPLTSGAIIQAVANVYLEQPISARAALASAFGILIPILATELLSGALALLGLLLIIPGVIFYLWWSLAIQVVVLEGLTGLGAMQRSKQLMQGNMLTGLLLVVLTFVIRVAISTGAEFIPWPPLRVPLSVTADAAMFALISAAWVVFYFSCRSKHESFDLGLLADQVGDQPAPASRQLSESS
jgi:hypothetical protein